MPAANKLSDARCRAAKPGAKPVKLFDGAGLALVVLPSGSKVWRLFVRQDGKQRPVTLGHYPATGLAEARSQAQEARERLRRGEEASPRSKARAAPVMTLQAACDEYWRGRKDVSAGYLSNATRGLAMHILDGPDGLAGVSVAVLTREMVLSRLRALDAEGRHVYVRRIRVWLAQVLDWAVEHGHATANVARSIDPERAFGRKPVEHHASVGLADVPALMQRLALERDLQSVLACRLLALTWVRTAELRMMRWDEIERADLWRIPAGRMKRRREHLVPLSRQAQAIIAVLRERSRGSGYVFPADHRIDRPMSENAVLYLLHRVGYKDRMTGHGFRTIGSTWANENGYTPDAIERQLAHAPDDRVRAAYNAAQFLPERVRMMQEFADWLLPAPAAPTP